jgi:hypothetical protein
MIIPEILIKWINAFIIPSATFSDRIRKADRAHVLSLPYIGGDVHARRNILGWLQPLRISSPYRLSPHIPIQIYPPGKSYGIGGYIPSRLRLVVAVVVVVEPCLRIIVLAGEPEGVLCCLDK